MLLFIFTHHLCGHFRAKSFGCGMLDMMLDAVEWFSEKSWFLYAILRAGLCQFLDILPKNVWGITNASVICQATVDKK